MSLTPYLSAFPASGLGNADGVKHLPVAALHQRRHRTSGLQRAQDAVQTGQILDRVLVEHQDDIVGRESGLVGRQPLFDAFYQAPPSLDPDLSALLDGQVAGDDAEPVGRGVAGD